MNNSYAPEDSLINSIVGEGTHFKGNVELDGLMRIDGDFTGSIRSLGKIIVGKNGRADCTIHAGTVVIGGVLRGAIYSTEKVIILASAVVIGIVHCPRLIAEEGVLMDGEFRVFGAAKKEREESTSTAAPDRERGRFFGFRFRERRDERDPATVERNGNGTSTAREEPEDKSDLRQARERTNTWTG